MGVRDAFTNIGAVVVVIWFVATVYILNTDKIPNEKRGEWIGLGFFALLLFILGMLVIVMAVTS